MVSVDSLIEDISVKLDALQVDHGQLDLRSKVLRLVTILQDTRRLNIAMLRTEEIDSRAARDRIRHYFTRLVGVTLDAIELEVVSGISDYGRRIRELRVQDGYKILSGASNDPGAGLVLRADQYLLLSVEPDKEAAHRWHIANRIRQLSDIGSQERILTFLQANVNRIVTSEELAYVAKASEFGRRTRELRTEQGFAIATHFTGRPDLKVGEYVLENLDRVAEPHDRHISEAVQREVFARDNNACSNCHWSRDQWTRADPRFLELHHFKGHVAGGQNVAANLVVLCNVCHDAVHAGRIVLM